MEGLLYCRLFRSIYALTLAQISYFAIFASRGRRRAGAPPPPLRFETKRCRAYRKKTTDCTRRLLAIGVRFFILGQYLTQIWVKVQGQVSNSRENDNLFKFTRVYLKHYESC